MNLEQDERRGEDARQILESPIYKEAWAAMRENIITRLEQASLTAEERKMWNDLLIVHGKAKKYMESILTTGTMAAMEMEKKRSLAERASSYLRRAV